MVQQVALFELADKSESNVEQTLYFESMRQLRLHREDMTQALLRRFYAGFESLFAGATGADSAGAAADASLDDLSLLGNDELEISVAISGIVSKVTAQHSVVLAALTKRLDHLCKATTINERTNPLGPTQLSEAFVDSLKKLELDIRVVIILLKLFERMVMGRIEPVYSAANKLLTEAGILPEGRRKAPAPQSGGGRGASTPAAPGVPAAEAPHPIVDSAPPIPGGSGTDYLGTPMHSIIDPNGSQASGFGYGVTGAPQNFSLIQQLMQSAQPPTPSHGNPVGGVGSGFNPYSQLGQGGYGSPYLGPTTEGGAGTGQYVISTPQLVGLLNELQTDQLHQSVDLEAPPPLLDLKNVVFNHTDIVENAGESHPSIERNDDDALNIVAMLFDFILNDRNLAIPMKALISRLQIPFVKLAVIDKSFFERSGHPARQLLNELASAGIGWSSAAELKRDALYDKIESTVVAVLNGFSNDAEFFADLLEDLRAFVKGEQQRNDVVEQRVQAAEAGKAHTQNVKLKVQQIINQKASGLRLPAKIGQFVSDTMARSLVMVGIKQGVESGDWHMTLKALDDLLWCCQPLDQSEQIEQRDAMLEELYGRLNGITGAIVDDISQRDDLLDGIRGEIEDAIERDRAYLGQDLDDEEFQQAVEELEPLEEITLTEATVFQSNDGPQIEPAFVEQLRGLNEGGWVELRRDSGALLRCKLTTIVQPGDRYVFVNRRGMKVAEYTRMDLAKRLQNGSLTLLDESEVFDRALQAVVGNLRELQKERQPKDTSPGDRPSS
ncbi:MAG: DUF1631 domain-containing protein [Pseudomonadota bacterium]